MTDNLKLVILLIGGVLLAAVGGIIALAITGHPIPDVLQNIAVGALTGLGGILVPASVSKPLTQQTRRPPSA